VNASVYKGSFALWDARKEECRRAARDLLARTFVSKPADINLEAIAFEAGRLRIERGGLKGADGRLVADGKRGGKIRVRAGMSESRFRFTVAHEIGHCCLHAAGFIDRTDSGETFRIWNEPGEEAEANVFSAELLLPRDLFLPKIQGESPSMNLIESLADEFRTSRLATAIQYVHYTNEAVALVVSCGWDIEWSRKTKEFLPSIKTGRVSKDSAAGERLAGIRGDSGAMVLTPAYAWLKDFDNRSEKDIKEDSVYLEYYDRTMTLLWWDDDE
jgi:Zn-dependent peptidase ImmA (M78 family)